MRVVVAGPTKVYRGQTVHLHARLKEPMTHAYCAVYSAVGKTSPSPHVPLAKLDVLKDGRPMMLNPTMLKLTPVRRDMTLELVVDEDCRLYIFQDVDVKGDPLVKARIKAHDRVKFFFAAAFRRLVRNR